ncbi:MAG TPA: response regulator [Polyangiaceae bacterium]|jgi:two-component system chemotaxis response regulator CheY|nr:response regulator [Polyangiaceae bacterium]
MKILVVDDSKAMRALIRRTLRGARYDEANISEAENGREAFDSIRSSPPDLVLANFNMPEMSGIELLERLHDDGVDVSFGFITSDDSEANVERARKAGARFVIGKPFSRQDLRRAVNEATEGKKNSP